MGKQAKGGEGVAGIHEDDSAMESFALRFTGGRVVSLFEWF